MTIVFLLIKSYRKCKWLLGDGAAPLSLPLRMELALSGKQKGEGKTCSAHLLCRPQIGVPPFLTCHPDPPPFPPTSPPSPPIHPRLKGEASNSSRPHQWDLSLFFLALVAGRSRPQALDPHSDSLAEVRWPCGFHDHGNLLPLDSASMPCLIH